MIGELLLTFGIALIVYACYNIFVLADNAQYFRQRGLKYKGVSFFISNLYRVFLCKNDVLEFTLRNYNAVPDEP